MAHILAVEDNADTRVLIRDLLQRGGYSVATVPDAERALDALERGSAPDLIILDLMLPGVEGIGLCRQIRQRAATRETPILIISAKNDTNSLRDSKEAGANDFILKPIAYAELIVTVRRLLGE